MASLRFYLDENVPVEVARQLKSRGIEAITVQELDMLGEDDVTHLQTATGQGVFYARTMLIFFNSFHLVYNIQD